MCEVQPPAEKQKGGKYLKIGAPNKILLLNFLFWENWYTLAILRNTRRGAPE